MKSWDEMKPEEKRRTLNKMADLLENKKLSDPEIRGKDFKKIREKTTIPFFNALKGRLEKEIKRAIRLYQGQREVKEIRPYFDYTQIKPFKKGKSTVYIGCHLGFSTKDPNHPLRKSLWWGMVQSFTSRAQKEKIIEDIKRKKLGLKIGPEEITSNYLAGVKNYLSVEEIRKEEKNPEVLLDRITKDIKEIYEKVIKKQNGGEISTSSVNLSFIINAINTKPFIILSGISGTGKTQIARIISAGRVKDEGI